MQTVLEIRSTLRQELQANRGPIVVIVLGTIAIFGVLALLVAPAVQAH